jgi:hypothetical protein
MEGITIEKILETGFVFTKLDIHPSFVDDLKALDFEKHTGKEELYVQGECFLEPDDWLGTFLKHKLSETTTDPAVLEGIDAMHFVVTNMAQGDRMNMHTDLEVTRSSVFHVCIWLPDEEFKGRDFIYGSKTTLRTHHPSFGDCVFINTISDEYVHGVSRLESDCSVVSVGGSPSLHTESGAKEEATAIHHGTVEDYLSEFRRSKEQGVFIRKNIS